jgi:hypothetical protein
VIRVGDGYRAVAGTEVDAVAERSRHEGETSYSSGRSSGGESEPLHRARGR